jgi:hypothetical protein
MPLNHCYRLTSRVVVWKRLRLSGDKSWKLLSAMFEHFWRRMPAVMTLGPKFKLTEHQMREAIKRRDHGDETLEHIGRSYNVSHSTISRLKA